MKIFIKRTLFFLFFLFFSKKIFPAGFAVRNQSASALGLALSSNGVHTEDASGIFSNPAVMSEIKERSFTIGVNYTDANKCRKYND